MVSKRLEVLIIFSGHIFLIDRKTITRSFLFIIHLRTYNNTCHQLNSPFISWPRINIPVLFNPSSDKTPITNQVHFTKVITQVVVHPSRPNDYYERTCPLEFSWKACYLSFLPDCDNGYSHTVGAPNSEPQQKTSFVVILLAMTTIIMTSLGSW